MKKHVVVDLCSGRAGWSAAMKARGWHVITVDNDPRFEPTIVADVRTLKASEILAHVPPGLRVDLVCASPPCIEFSRESMPWTKRGIVPDMSIVVACIALAHELDARFWILENVRGAIKWFKACALLGEARYRCSPIFLWGEAPVDFQPPKARFHKKQHPGDRPDLRAMIPWNFSLALARAVENDRGDRRGRARRRDLEDTGANQVQLDAPASLESDPDAAARGAARREPAAASSAQPALFPEAQLGPYGSTPNRGGA